ncbi:pyridoxal phosphate-dependent aminotransferase [Candidatus Puniceispirillum marinum]|uniref:Aminotransferase n=1 Tax=Puniceispirillum marinum (strain IMCC1322) TaxID=488538 RepID=D5BSH0_PUNMI|nr:pyridoxal phosphate-dependent aminotransferase [Candidatus Puniceispirillum marinum]ADE39217.1 aminotransferase, class I and II [Candidatus Puniceispirillum marinum IMCC1322]
MIAFSKISAEITSQPMFEILSEVQKIERSGLQVLHFELGEPDFPTPENIKHAARQAITDNFTKYAPSSGLHEFKEVVQEATFQSRGFKPNLNQVLVTPGANAIIYLALKCVLDVGDEVIVPDPGFPTYFSAIKSLGGTIRPLNLNEKTQFSFTIADLEKLINKKTKAIIVNTPSNPTGQTLSADILHQLYEMANKNNILLISDEIYSRLIFEDESFYSPSQCDNCQSNTLILNGFSKAFSMTGWRLGVAVGPEPLIKIMENLTSTIVSCVPPFIQKAGIEAIIGDQSTVKTMVSTYHKRAQLIVDGLNSIQGIECIMPKGSIYAFPNITGTGFSSDEFCQMILHKCNIAATPGNCFGNNGEGYVRFSTVNNEAVIQLAISRLQTLFGKK